MVNYKILEIFIKPLLRYQDAIFPIFGGFWGAPRTSMRRGVVKHLP